MFESVDLPRKSSQIPAHWGVWSPLDLAVALVRGDVVTFWVSASYAKDAPDGAETARIQVTLKRLDALEATEEERDWWGADPGEFYFEATVGESAVVKPGSRIAGCVSMMAKTTILWRLKADTKHHGRSVTEEERRR